MSERSDPAAPRKVPVWSIGVRLLHWTLAASMIVSFATHEGGGRLHEVMGYVALAAASLRVLLGFFGATRWRFRGFVRGVGETARYGLDVWHKREARFLGHNPLGGWMVLILLANALAAGVSGWLYTTDWFWGVAWMEELHGALGEALVPLLLLHLAGVVFTSWRHRENLAAAMVHGGKRAAVGTDRP